MDGVVAGGVDPSKIDTIVFDLDGVLYVDSEPVPGAGEALSDLSGRYKLLFATNNSTRTAETIVEHIASRTGFGPDASAIATSAIATARVLADRYRRALVVGEPGLVETMQHHGIGVVESWEEADVVVVGLDRGISYRRLADATLAIRAGAAFYATNADATYPMPDGLYPGGGAIAAALETASDTAPVVCGKPHDPMRQLIEEMAASHAVLVVGDRAETDIALGKTSGWSTALVLTGVVGGLDEVPDEYRPDVVIASVADLPKIL